MIPVGFGDVIAVSFAVDGHKVAPCLILKSNLFFPSYSGNREGRGQELAELMVGNGGHKFEDGDVIWKAGKRGPYYAEATRGELPPPRLGGDFAGVLGHGVENAVALASSG